MEIGISAADALLIRVITMRALFWGRRCKWVGSVGQLRRECFIPVMGSRIG
jgi:hypothetical protein